MLSGLAGAVQWQKFVSADGRFSFHHPAGWQVKEQGGMLQLTHAATGEEMVTLSLINPNRLQPVDLAAQVMERLRQALPDLTTLQLEPMGDYLARAHFTVTNQGVAYEGLALLALQGGSAQWLSYSCPPDVYSRERAQALLQGVLASFAAADNSVAPQLPVPELPSAATNTKPAEPAAAARTVPIPDYRPDSELARFLVGKWRVLIKGGSIAGYRDYVFFENGVFVKETGATASSTTPLNNYRLLKFVHSQMTEGECGTYRLRGSELQLMWADDGSVETIRLNILSGGGTSTTEDDFLEIGTGSRYQRVGVVDIHPTIPAGMDNIRLQIRTDEGAYTPPILRADPALLNQFIGLNLRLFSYGPHNLSIKIPAATWQQLFSRPGQPVSLAELTSFQILASQRSGVYAMNDYDRGRQQPVGRITLLNVKPTQDQNTYLVSLALEGVVLYRSQPSYRYPRLEVTAEIIDLPVSAQKQ
jgi:hypothetical protein